MPSNIRDVQKNIDPRLGQALLMSGVLHCLPFLANLLQTKDVANITEEEIEKAGVTNAEERANVLDAFSVYLKELNRITDNKTSLPSPIQEPSAPSVESVEGVNVNECTICMDFNCDIIFVPCGHFCCCSKCASPLEDCPMCRATITSKIRVYTN